MNVGTGYRELDPWETVQGGAAQEAMWCGEWRPMNTLPASVIPGPYSDWKTHRWTIRTKIEVPRTFPPMSQEAKDSMREDAMAMMEMSSTIPQESQNRRDTGYTAEEIRQLQNTTACHVRVPRCTMQGAADNLHRAMGPRESAFRKEHGVPDDMHTDMTQLAAFVDAQSSPDSVKITVSEPSLENQHAHMLHDMGVRAHTFPDPSAPVKPFTPNKYTRNMPTMDGRTVPVDVYCVLAAFPTGSSAVDHAVKKLLAPGQRGHKDRIQDLKEARDSLTRAIELEEAVQG